MIRAIVLSFVAGVVLSPQINHLMKPATIATARYVVAAFNIASYGKIVAALP